MNNDLSICFYFPYNVDSGVPVLFYRMTNELAISYPEISISIIDYEDGVMWRNVLDRKNITRIKFEDNVKIVPPINSILIMQTFVPYYWPKELVLEENQKLFFWNLHPHNLIPSLLPLPFLREIPYNNFRIYYFLSFFYKKLIKRLRNYTNCLIDNKGLSFMDKSNLDYTSKHLFLPIINRDFIPVPASSSTFNFNLNDEVILGGVIRFTWIGRLCDFKSYILVYTIKKLNEISIKFINRNFEFNIVGEGPFEDYIRSEIKNCKNLSVIFHGSIPHNEIDNFILIKTDIIMAMGTSALEGAKLGKPTFLLDPVLKEIKEDYVFRMIYDTKEFDLGHFITTEDFLKNNTSFYDLLLDIINNYKFHSIKSFDYFEYNHNIKNVKLHFLQKIMNSNLVYSMIDKTIFNKSPLLKIYNNFRGLKS
jgi:hypothetical protein